jgi:hypothetical protein
MSIDEYRKHLREQGISDDSIMRQIPIIEDFIGFLEEPGSTKHPADAGKGEVERYARKLIAEGRNTLEHLSALCDYCDWLGQRKLYVALVELMDCHNALDVLAAEIEKRHGREVREQVFSDPIPPLGADEKERGAYTRKILERMSQQLTPEQAGEAWFQVQHGIPAGYWSRHDQAEKEKYQKYGSIDEFLNAKRQERDAMLAKLRDNNELWYTVEISDEVLEFVRSDPEMEGGRRDGDRIYITKIPYNATRYLQETDPKLKRYFACHCPLLREAILDDRPISQVTCNCSLGHASHYLAGLGMELKGEVLESVIKGDTRCRFVFYLPE